LTEVYLTIWNNIFCFWS